MRLPSTFSDRRWLVAGAVASATFLFHLLTNAGYGFFRDELYFIACGRHLAWGFVDQPPVTPAIAAASAWLAGESTTLFRLPAAVAHFALVLLTGGFARRLGGNVFAVALAATCVAVAPIFLSEGHLLTMNAFEPLSWLGLAWLVWTATPDSRGRWLAAGAVLGVAILNKHSAGFYAVALFGGLVLSSQRRVLASPWPWLGAGLALLIISPHLAWQFSHGWPMFELLRNGQLYKNTAFEPGGFAKEVVLALHPLALPVWLGGLWWLFRERGTRALGWAWVILIALFVALNAKFYYVAPAFPPLFAAGAVWWERVLASWPRARWAMPVVVALSGLALSPLAVPYLPPERFLTYQRTLGIEPPRMERHVYRELPQVFADELGWEELARTVSEVYRGLPPEERSGTVAFAQNYGEAAAIDFYARRFQLPKAISGHNAYWTWGPGNPQTVLIIGGEAVDHREVCGALVLARRVPPNPYVMAYEDALPIYVCQDLKVAAEDFWPRARHFE